MDPIAPTESILGSNQSDRILIFEYHEDADDHPVQTKKFS